jgi:hypothetical protein
MPRLASWYVTVYVSAPRTNTSSSGRAGVLISAPARSCVKPSAVSDPCEGTDLSRGRCCIRQWHATKRRRSAVKPGRTIRSRRSPTRTALRADSPPSLTLCTTTCIRCTRTPNCSLRPSIHSLAHLSCWEATRPPGAAAVPSWRASDPDCPLGRPPCTTLRHHSHGRTRPSAAVPPLGAAPPPDRASSSPPQSPAPSNESAAPYAAAVASGMGRTIRSRRSPACTELAADCPPAATLCTTTCHSPPRTVPPQKAPRTYHRRSGRCRAPLQRCRPPHAIAR